MIKKAIVVLAGMIALNGHTHPCQNDAHEMKQQIVKHYSITTINGYQVKSILSERPIGYQRCVAKCMSYGYPFLCYWTQGNWQRTLFAEG